MAYNYLKKIAYFYPRPPRGGRLDSDFRSLWDKLFLSTPSARRATREQIEYQLSIKRFLSTPSARRATGKADGEADAQKFLSTPSARRATPR